MNCKDQAFTQCVNDVTSRLLTSYVYNGSACNDVSAYVIVTLLIFYGLREH